MRKQRGSALGRVSMWLCWTDLRVEALPLLDTSTKEEDSVSSPRPAPVLSPSCPSLLPAYVHMSL